MTALALPNPLYGPDFGSYNSAEVGWLLTDLSSVSIEAPVEEREEAIQSGAAHYAESLPIEYQPSAEYQRLFDTALDAAAADVARAAGVVTEAVLAKRGPGAVLVSLARAGTPIGILMRRWAAFAHQLELPHYAISIVRGRGIDTVALEYLLAHYDPATIMFVDGWTGKGAIARELADAVNQANHQLNFPAQSRFSPALAVLADTGLCADISGTREDFLIPSALLNSTVSGLVSRTVLNAKLTGRREFHGAKYYSNLAGSDVSNRFLDVVSSRFSDVAAAVRTTEPDSVACSPRSRWQLVEDIAARYGISDINLVKPGVGETTRVLLRRVPWKVLVRADALPDLGHVLLLAEQRGVEVELVDDLPYRCIGLIQPRLQRGAGVVSSEMSR